MLNGRREDGLNWTGTILPAPVQAVTLCKPALEIYAALCTLGGYRVAQGDVSRKIVHHGRAALAALPLQRSGCAAPCRTRLLCGYRAAHRVGALMLHVQIQLLLLEPAISLPL